jgi:uncharacterized protein (DUF111 family)
MPASAPKQTNKGSAPVPAPAPGKLIRNKQVNISLTKG